MTILQAGHDIRCMFTTPKLLEALALRLESMGTTIRKMGITGIFSGGTEFTPQWNRFAHEELLDGAYMTPTYGNTLMGLAASAPSGPHNNYKITYYAPQPRAVIEVVDFDDPNKVVGLRPDRTRETDDADQRILHARISRARRRRARASLRKVSVGRRQRRPALPRVRRNNNSGSVLDMIQLPVLRWGQPYKASKSIRSSISRPASRSQKWAAPTAD